MSAEAVIISYSTLLAKLNEPSYENLMLSLRKTEELLTDTFPSLNRQLIREKLNTKFTDNAELKLTTIKPRLLSKSKLEQRQKRKSEMQGEQSEVLETDRITDMFEEFHEDLGLPASDFKEFQELMSDSAQADNKFDKALYSLFENTNESSLPFQLYPEHQKYQKLDQSVPIEAKEKLSYKDWVARFPDKNPAHYFEEMFYFDFACVLSKTKEAADIPFKRVFETVFENQAKYEQCKADIVKSIQEQEELDYESIFAQKNKLIALLQSQKMKQEGEVKQSRAEAKKRQQREKKQRKKEKQAREVSWLMNHSNIQNRYERRELLELYRKEGRDKKRVYDLIIKQEKHKLIESGDSPPPPPSPPQEEKLSEKEEVKEVSKKSALSDSFEIVTERKGRKNEVTRPYGTIQEELMKEYETMDRIQQDQLRVQDNFSIKLLAQKSMKLKTQMSSFFKMALRAHHLQDQEAFDRSLEQALKLKKEFKHQRILDALKIFKIKNTHLSKYEQVDLHGLFVNEAVPITKSILQKVNHMDLQQKKPFKIITGAGRHSRDGKSKLLPAIQQLLAREGYKFNKDKGSFLVKLH